MSGFMGLVKDRGRMLKSYKDVGDERIANEPLSIIIPKRFELKNLAHLGAKTAVLGMCAIVAGDNYALMTVPGMLYLGPSEKDEIEIGDQTYIRFSFLKGDVVIENLNIVQDDSLLYTVNDEFIARGKLPGYFSYDDLPTIFRYTDHFTGVKIGVNANTMDFFYSLMGRDVNNLESMVRNNQDVRDIEIIALRNISLTAPSPMTKMSGAYMEDGLEVSLVTKSESIEQLEQLVRS